MPLYIFLKKKDILTLVFTSLKAPYIFVCIHIRE